MKGCSGGDQQGRTCLFAVEGAGVRDAAVSGVLDGDDKLVVHINSGRGGRALLYWQRHLRTRSLLISCIGLAMAAMGRHNEQSRCCAAKCTGASLAVDNSKLWGLCMPDLAAASLATQLGMLLSVTALVPLTSSKPCSSQFLLTADVDRA